MHNVNKKEKEAKRKNLWIMMENQNGRFTTLSTVQHDDLFFSLTTLKTLKTKQQKQDISILSEIGHF